MSAEKQKTFETCAGKLWGQQCGQNSNISTQKKQNKGNNKIPQQLSISYLWSDQIWL